MPPPDEVVRDEHLARLVRLDRTDPIQAAADRVVVVVHGLVGHRVAGLDGVRIRQQPHPRAVSALAEDDRARLGPSRPAMCSPPASSTAEREPHALGTVVVAGDHEHGHARSR